MNIGTEQILIALGIALVVGFTAIALCNALYKSNVNFNPN